MDILELLLSFFTDYGYLAVFIVLLLCGFGLPVPEDITLVAGGIISGLGYANVHVMFALGMAGVLLGDGTMFTIGRCYGKKVMSIRPIARILTPRRFAMVQEKFSRYGNWVLFVARFLPGLRSPIFITAGMSRRISYWQFLLMDGFAALISVPIWVYLGYLGAANREWLMRWVRRGQTGILIAVAILAIVLIILYLRHRRRLQRSARHSATKDGRDA